MLDEVPPIKLSGFLNRQFRLWIVVVGLLGTLMPWYVQMHYGTQISLNLLGGLTDPNNLGLELTGLLFYAGLAASAMRQVRWSVLGEMLMVPAIAIGALSTDGWSVGFGQVIDVMVVVLIGVVILARVMED